MPVIKKSTAVTAPAERVFEILADPKLAHELNPDLVLTSYTPSTIGGFDNSWEYKMSGLKFKGTTRMLVVERPFVAIYETTGDLPSRWSWHLQSQGETTLVEVELDYTIPKLLNNPLLRPSVEKTNEKVITNQVANLKRLSETS
ncbi:MAG: SRPBCC family protein [Chloroflexi bacterium]|nr:SRPBCC family protein [Chloroflexota bacterium]OJV91910.1 MAG: hypothetical protein BGO39_14390 [Chloroflexi bacterium 54-19]